MSMRMGNLVGVKLRGQGLDPASIARLADVRGARVSPPASASRVRQQPRASGRVHRVRVVPTPGESHRWFLRGVDGVNRAGVIENG